MHLSRFVASVSVAAFSCIATLGSVAAAPQNPVLNPSNGHHYLLVDEQWNWTDAKSLAESMVWQGQSGHLATITDQAELDWILQNIAPSRPWIGLFQNLASPGYVEPSGGWEWVTGEPFTFDNWAMDEPSDTSASGGPEDYCELFANGEWNDAELNHSFTNQYLVEWSDGSIGTNYCAAAPNSTGVPGTIEAAGSTLVADNDFVLTAADLPNASFGFFLVSPTPSFVPGPGGSSGNLCLGGAIGRYVGPGQIQNSGQAGEFSLALDLDQVPTPTGFTMVTPGSTWNFQAWHRDSSMTGATSNFTDGLEVVFL